MASATRTTDATPLSLIRAYLEHESRWQRALAAVWTVIAILCIVLFVLYAVAHAVASGPNWLVAALAVGPLLWLIFIGEGAEVAAISLQLKELDQVTDKASKTTLRLLQTGREADFVNGRQTVVISMIVFLTFVMELYADLPAHSAQLGLLSRFLDLEVVKVALKLGFPTFVVLWLAQLYPKLLASAHPLTRFSMPSHQWMIKSSMAIGKWTNIGAPPALIGMIRNQTLAGGRLHADEELRPSRRELYRSLALYMYGMGIVGAQRRITIGDNGSVQFDAKQKREIMARGTRRIQGSSSWEAAIAEASVDLVITRSDDPLAKIDYDTPLSGAEFGGHFVPNGMLRWTANFRTLLPRNTVLTERLRLSTGADAMKMRDSETESYEFAVSRPFVNLAIQIEPAKNSSFMLHIEDFDVEGVDSDNDEFKVAERKRIRYGPTRNGGVLLVARWPCVGSKITMNWRVGKR